MTKRLILSNYPGNNIYSIDDGKLTKVNDTNKIILPPNSVYFHFNEELLDDFLPLIPPNQNSGEKSKYFDKNVTKYANQISSNERNLEILNNK